MRDSGYKKVEVLAPAGSYDIFTAVIAAGADAVYLGGDMFGARAFAGNFDKDELIRALDYAHIRGKKIYMTVNTLLKENELGNMLVDYIVPFYEAGLDAAIVQDMGVFKTLRENFPELALHASTQMTVTGSYGASILEKMGASRVVTARELNFDEIRSIREKCSIEIESFVHGALCYCYSGQCLLSSMNGQRSGNRGRCAQACRLPYDVYNIGSADRVNDKNSLYALSPKDMCALDILPQIIGAGVNSLKIEGRMKNVTYAAGVTALYRKYTDMYLERGAGGYHVDRQDIMDLVDIYNRGEFTSGYYNHSKGREMMSVQRPNHIGTKALEVLENVSGRVTFKVLTAVNRQDVFEIDSRNSFASGDNYLPGSKMVVNLPKKYNLPKGRILYRTRNNAITQRVIENYVDRQLKTKVNMYLYGQCGMPLCLVLEALETTVTVYGDVVEAASKQPADSRKTAEQLAALGNTDFVAENVQVQFEGDIFIPASRLKALRREGIERLTEAILAKSRRDGIEQQAEAILENARRRWQPLGSGEMAREAVVRADGVEATVLEAGVKQTEGETDIESTAPESCVKPPALEAGVKQTEEETDIESTMPEVSVKPTMLESCLKPTVLATNIEQLKSALSNRRYKELYIDFSLAENSQEKNSQEKNSQEKNSQKKNSLAENLSNNSLEKPIFLALPHILRGKNVCKCRKLMEKAADFEFDGFLVRNLEELGLIAELAAEAKYQGSRNIILDAGLYCWNTKALHQYKDIIENAGLKLKRITMPYELRADEMIPVAKEAERIGVETELIVSSRIPLMISEQCVRKTYGLCDKNNSTIMLENMKNGHYIVKSICDYCYSIMYSEPYDITAMKEQIEAVKPDCVRYEGEGVAIEKYESVSTDKKCEGLAADKKCKSAAAAKNSAVFTGHFDMGVD